MSIRLRRLDGTLVALCAARSVERPGDVYLDDEQHYALARKFALDCGCEDTNEHAALIEQEESNNPAREWWDKEYGRAVGAAPCTLADRAPQSTSSVKHHPTQVRGFGVQWSDYPKVSPHGREGQR